VAVSAGSVARGAAIALAVGLLASAGLLLAAGLHQRAQANDLEAHGVHALMTVTGCVGLLGGSGSNAAGYACRGTYRYRGVTYAQAVPGNIRRAPGSMVQVVIASDDPELVSAPGTVALHRSLASLVVIPSLLALGGLGALAPWALRASRRRVARPSGAQAGGV